MAKNKTKSHKKRNAGNNSNLLSILKSIVASFVGASASSIVDLLYGKKNINEFLIAKKLKLTINQARNVLYKLGDEGVVGFIRKKDSKKGGWYTYFWTLNTGRSLIKFRENMQNKLEQAKKQKDGKIGTRFFKCKNCGFEFTEENALSHNYICQECGEVLELKDMKEELAELDKEIGKIENALAKVSLEIVSIEAEEQKARTRKLKTEERKKKKERDAKRKVLARAMARAKNKGKKKSNKRITRKKRR